MPTQQLVSPTADPIAERAQFFLDLEMAELRAVIPQAQPVEPKQVY